MVLEHGSTLRMDGKCVDHAFMLVSYVFSMLVVYMCFFHPCCVSNGGSGVAMEMLMVLLSTCCHKCMIGYVFLMLMYCLCMFAYILLHIVHAFLAYARLTYWSFFGVIHV